MLSASLLLVYPVPFRCSLWPPSSFPVSASHTCTARSASRQKPLLQFVFVRYKPSHVNLWCGLVYRHTYYPPSRSSFFSIKSKLEYSYMALSVPFRLQLLTTPPSPHTIYLHHSNDNACMLEEFLQVLCVILADLELERDTSKIGYDGG